MPKIKLAHGLEVQSRVEELVCAFSKYSQTFLGRLIFSLISA